MALRKYSRSGFLVKPASWELFWSRTSITRFTPACLRRVKKFSAVDFVKPMVKSFMAAGGGSAAERRWSARLDDGADGLGLPPDLQFGCGGDAGARLSPPDFEHAGGWLEEEHAHFRKGNEGTLDPRPHVLPVQTAESATQRRHGDRANAAALYLNGQVQ
jgi:hypothetical protein